MKFWFGLIFAALMTFGCKQATGVDASSNSIPANAADRRVMSKGVMRLKTSYTLNANQFSSTCAAVLIHTPEPSLNYCVAISAAHCFRNIPENAQHSLEFVDGKGEVVKSHRVAEVTMHPEFTVTDATQSLEQAAVDVALLEFKCALPEAIQPARILDVSVMPADTKLLTTRFVTVKTEQKSGPMDALIDGVLGHEPMTSSPIFLFQSPVELLSIDFPGRDLGGQSANPAGVLNLSNPSESDTCNGDAGAPVFAQAGQDIFLLATASSGTGFCDKEKLLYSITSSHSKWINETLEMNVVVLNTSPELPLSADKRSKELQLNDRQTKQAVQPKISTEKLTDSKTKLLESEITNSSENERDSVAEASMVPSQSPTVTPSPKAVHSPVAVLPVPNALPTIRPQIAKAPKKKPKDIQPSSIPTARPTVAPIPPPPPPDAVDEECMGIRLTAKSKSAVWGTFLKLVDKDFAQIADESLKCEFSNENELCVVAKPVPTGTGNSRVVLSQSINQAGCSKFYSGRTIYILQDDFQFSP
jgi:hypothetical protein